MLIDLRNIFKEDARTQLPTHPLTFLLTCWYYYTGRSGTSLYATWCLLLCPQGPTHMGRNDGLLCRSVLSARVSRPLVESASTIRSSFTLGINLTLLAGDDWNRGVDSVARRITGYRQRRSEWPWTRRNTCHSTVTITPPKFWLILIIVCSICRNLSISHTEIFHLT